MSKLRPECSSSKKPALPDDTAIYLIRDSVAKRRSLAFGQLRNNKHSCAMGAFWDDNPNAIVNTALVDEVAAVNDSIPKTATPHERWKKVNSWLRWKIAVMAGKKVSA